MKTGKSTVEVEIHPGQFIFGRDSAARELKMRPSTVRNRIKKLKNMQNLDIKADKQYSIITIKNWAIYQDPEIKKDSKEDRQRTGKGQAKDTDNHLNNVENGNGSKEPLSGKEPDAPRNGIPFQKIIQYLNDQSGKSFSPKAKNSRRHIQARWAEGYRYEDFKKVVDRKVDAWKGNSEMVDYLRPQTLFGPKFEAYLNETGGAGNAWRKFLEKHE